MDSPLVNTGHLLPAWLQVSVPSADRPFGIYLWPIFAQVFNKITGWDADTWKFVEGDASIPFSSFKSVAVTIAIYYVIIFGGREVLRKAPVIKAAALFKVHNLLLTLLSLSLLLLMVEQIFPILYHHGLLFGICDKRSYTQKLVVLYYLNYLTKFYELFDTVFLVIRKKPLTFLHTYHHGATAALCFSQLIGATSVQWVVIALNLLVHVVMYWYYFLAACGIRVWWREWVTRLQIIQFVIDLGFVYFASYTYFAEKYFPYLPNMGSCNGEEFAAVYGCLLLSSYLVLFILFYINNYVKKKLSKGKGGKASANKPAAEGAAATTTQSEGRQLRSRKA